MQFATPPKITLSHWLLFLDYVLDLELRLVLKLSNMQVRFQSCTLICARDSGTP